MTTSAAQASVSWAQALSWRLERQFLDPVGSTSVSEVVRRLGAVLSMDEALAELAVRTRSASSQPGDLGLALGRGEVIKAFTFRGPFTICLPRRVGSIWR